MRTSVSVRVGVRALAYAICSRLLNQLLTVGEKNLWTVLMRNIPYQQGLGNLSFPTTHQRRLVKAHVYGHRTMSSIPTLAALNRSHNTQTKRFLQLIDPCKVSGSQNKARAQGHVQQAPPNGSQSQHERPTNWLLLHQLNPIYHP